MEILWCICLPSFLFSSHPSRFGSESVVPFVPLGLDLHLLWALVWGVPALNPCIQTSSLLSNQPQSPCLSPAPQRINSLIIRFSKTQPCQPTWPYLCGDFQWGLGIMAQPGDLLWAEPHRSLCALCPPLSCSWTEVSSSVAHAHVEGKHTPPAAVLVSYHACTEETYGTKLYFS